MHIRTFHNEADFIKKSASLILDATKNKGFNIAISGGNTPKPIYKAVADQLKQLPENQSLEGHFYQVDERYTPASNDKSNQKMILEAGIPLNMHFKTTLSLPKCIEEYDKKLPKTPFDLCVLGIGPDGHTASIFPNSSAINSTQSVVHTTTKEFDVKDRLSLTFKVIMQAKSLLVLIKDRPKVLSQLKNPRKNENQFPALKLLQHPKLMIHNFRI